MPEAVTWQELLEETHSDTEQEDTSRRKRRQHSGAPQYDAIFTELAVVGGLVVRGLRVVVPKTPRDKVIKLAHEGHQGITKTKE